ncbi:MAG TPA: DUF6691 family protein [Polyangiaceae bacterium]|jgi:hypothetical protein
MNKTFVSLACGAIFGAGLVVSGMTDTAKVQAFLDVRGAWDPALAFVMAAAVATCAVLYAIARRRAGKDLAPVRPIDARLVTGAAVFGVGWGLVGACPAPAIVTLGSGALWSIVFVASTLVGARLESSAAKRAVARQLIADS